MIDRTTLVKELTMECGFTMAYSLELCERYNTFLEKGILANKIADEIVMCERARLELDEEDDFPSEVIANVERTEQCSA